MASKKELSVVVSNGYQPVNSSSCPKSSGLTSDKILLLSDELLLTGEVRKKNAIHKSGSSNLLADKTKSIVELIIFVFFCVKSGIAKQQYLCKWKIGII